MNLIENIFFEFFNNKYYYSKDGRAYIEYISSLNEGFLGKICFFHFSLSHERKNSYNNIEILNFIKNFYSKGYNVLYPIMRYCIKNDIVMSLNSINEFEFVIKFWNENNIIIGFIENIIFLNTNKNFSIYTNKNTRFFELQVNIKNDFFIDNLKIYSENFDTITENIYEKGYLDYDNIFMKLDIYKLTIVDLKLEEGLLFKLRIPIKFSESNFLMSNFFNDSMKKFNKNEIFLGFIEKWNNKNDIIFFTNKYSIKA